MLEKTTQINLLYDFYQNLLTEKQRLYMELYYQEDLSLGEIAEQSKVSRQAVFENIKRAEALLQQYERELQLLSKHEQRQRLFEQLYERLEQHSHCQLDEIKKLISALHHVD